MTPRAASTAGEQRNWALLLAPLTAAALIAQQVASNALRDALFLTWFRGHDASVLHGCRGGAGDPGGGVIRPSPGPFRPGSLRPAHPRRRLSAVPGGVESGRRIPARGVGAGLLSRQCAWRHRHLDVLVAAQRALRPAHGQGADGARRRGGRLWRPGWRRRRGARDGPPVSGGRVGCAGTVGRRVRGGFRVHRSRNGSCGRCDQRRRKTAGADGPRSGACHCFAISPWSSHSPRRSRHWSTMRSRWKSSTGWARASRWYVSSASSMPGRPSPRSCCRPLLGRQILARIGLGGSVTSHPLLVGAAGLVSFVAPAPWRGILPRGLDVTLRASIFRAGYELFYTPLPEAAKRAAKSVVDVSADCVGKGAGAALIVLLTRLDPVYTFVSSEHRWCAHRRDGIQRGPSTAGPVCARARGRTQAPGRGPQPGGPPSTSPSLSAWRVSTPSRSVARWTTCPSARSPRLRTMIPLSRRSPLCARAISCGSGSCSVPRRPTR